MKRFLINIVILLAVIVISDYFSGEVGLLYERVFGGGGFLDFKAIIGFPLVYIFFLALLFTAFGGTKKYWWIVVLLIPVAAFELYFETEHIYLPIMLGAGGWLLGYLVLTIRNSFTSVSRTDGKGGKPT